MRAATCGSVRAVAARSRGRLSAHRHEPIQLRASHRSVDGLPNGTVYGIRSDAQGAALGQHELRARAPRSRQRARCAHSIGAHGLQGEEFNFGAHYASPRGRVLLRRYQRLQRFPSRAAALQQRCLRRSCSRRCRLSNAARLTGAGGASSCDPLHLDLSRRHRSPSSLRRSTIAAPNANTFQLPARRIAKQDWVDAGTRRNVTYAKLRGGRYVAACAARRMPTAPGTNGGLAIEMDVDPPPWRIQVGPMHALRAARARTDRLGVGRASPHARARSTIPARTSKHQVRERTRELETHARRAGARQPPARRDDSFTDPLTGLGNRRSLNESMKQIHRRAAAAADASRVSQ